MANEANTATTPTATIDAAKAAQAALTKSAAAAPAPGKVFVITDEGMDSPIHKYKNGTHGYLKLQAQVIVMEKQWPRLRKRSMLYKASLDVLEHILKNEVSKKDMSLPGQLVIKEFVYNDEFMNPDNELAAPYASQLDLEQEDVELRLKSYLKRDGADDATILRVGEDPILRFTEYDHDRTEEDTLVAYDNLKEVRLAREERKAAKK